MGFGLRELVAELQLQRRHDPRPSLVRPSDPDQWPYQERQRLVLARPRLSFVRSRVYDVAAGEDERVLESYDSFTQRDFRFAEKHHLTTTFSYFPLEVDNLGLNALVTANATPDFNSKGWNFAVSERSFFSRTFVETIIAVKTFDVAVGPKGDAPSRLTPEGLRGNYFNELDRDSLRFEVASSCTHAAPDLFGEHIMKIGGNVSYTSFTGTDMGRRVEILSNEGGVIQRVEYVGDPAVGGEDVQFRLTCRDRWRLTDCLGFNIGLRYDYDRLVSEHQLAPRVSTAFALDRKGRTVIKAGWGIFYDRVLLYATASIVSKDAFERNFGADGLPKALRSFSRPVWLTKVWTCRGAQLGMSSSARCSQKTFSCG